MADESVSSDTAVSGAGQQNNTENSPTVDLDRLAERSVSLRPIFHKWFFSTDRRYQMFQTIVGGTIANLLAAGIIAGIAVASGSLKVSFSWSWPFFWRILPIPGGFGLILGIATMIAAHSDDEPKIGWPSSIGVGLFVAISIAFTFDFIASFFDALSFSIAHINVK
jgi:hypothetical protein